MIIPLFAALAGLFVGVVFSFFISSRFRKKENVLSDRLDYLEDLLDSAPLGFFCKIKKGTHVVYLASRRLRLLLNIAEEQVDKSLFIRQFQSGSAQLLQKNMDQLEKHHVPFSMVADGRIPLGSFNVSGTVLETTPFEAVVLWIENVDGYQQKIDEIQHKLLEALNKTELFATVLNALPLPIYVTDRDQNILFQNQHMSGEEVTDLSFQKTVLSDLIHREMVIHYALDTSPEENLKALLSESQTVTRDIFKELSTPMALFSAGGRLFFYNKAFTDLWQLENYWLKKEPLFEDFLNKIQEKGLLPDVKDFSAYKQEQKNKFALTTRTTEELLCLPNNLLIRQLLIPYTQGSLLMVNEKINQTQSPQKPTPNNHH